MFVPSLFIANLLIVLREGLEAVLIVGIIAAYLKKIGRTSAFPMMWLGVAIAAAIPFIAGAIMTFGPARLETWAAEAIGGVLSIVAAAMITGMLVWMGKHSREQKRNLESQMDKALADNKSDWAIVSIAIIAVGREGLETAIMVWGVVKSSIESSSFSTTLGLVAGLAIAVVLGWQIYRGALRFNMRRFFTVTGYFLVFVAAGIFSYGIHDLQEAGLLPGLNTFAWDFSTYYPAQGSILHILYLIMNAMFQFNLQPTVLQTIAWIIYTIITLIWFTRICFPRKTASLKNPIPQKGIVDA